MSDKAKTTEKLVPRFMAAIPEGRGELYAFAIRDGLAIHQHPTGPYLISATGCGRRVSAFDSVPEAEAALQELAPLADWGKASAEVLTAEPLKTRIVAVLRRHGGFSPDDGQPTGVQPS